MSCDHLAPLKIMAIVSQSPKAWRVRVDGHEEPVWFPKSQCRMDIGLCVVWVPEWLLEAKGISALVDPGDHDDSEAYNWVGEFGDQ